MNTIAGVRTRRTTCAKDLMYACAESRSTAVVNAETLEMISNVRILARAVVFQKAPT
jgi:hypothetical protein